MLKKLIILLFCSSLFMLSGCATRKPKVVTLPLVDSIIDTLVAHPIAPDSATIKLKIDWQANSIQQVADERTKRMNIEWKAVDSNHITIKAHTSPDTVFLPSRTIVKSIPIPIEIETPPKKTPHMVLILRILVITGLALLIAIAINRLQK